MEIITGQYGRALLTIPASSIEATCLAQITAFVNHPAFTGLIVIMPDTHAGKGAVIGFTMPLGGMVVPNVVGGDIGCALYAICFGRDLPIAAEDIDRFVRAHVPFGMAANPRPLLDMARDFPWKRANELAAQFTARYAEAFGESLRPPRYGLDWFLAKCAAIGAKEQWIVNSLGSMGGNNHFIEIGRAQSDGRLWLTVHSGSRNFGTKIAQHWQDLAAKRHPDCDRELAWLEGEDAAGYLFDMVFAQVYAETNRRLIAETLRRAMGAEVLDEVHTVHNFIDFGDFVIRKGAVRSYVGERLLVPFNRQAGILLCEGKSNPGWNRSAPHGAGRLMSRGDARRKLDVVEYQQQMRGIFSSTVGADTIDEAPGAYKDPAFIEAAIGPTATILDRIIPIYSFKDDTREARRRR